MRFEKEIEVARAAAVRSAELALKHQAAGVRAETKSDNSPVTIADRESEKLIVAALDEAFPDDGILGEEGTRKDSTSGRRWIIDPIDGTRDFVRGNPLWSVLIGLEDHGEMVAGVAHLPVLGWTYCASRGNGAYRNDTPIRVSQIADVSMAVLSLNGLSRMTDAPFAGKVIDWAGRFWSCRSLGGTPDAMLLAAGQMEVWIEPKVAAWDLAATQVILEEAGAVFFSFSGERTIYGGSAAACTPGLEAELRAFLA
jgi:histidinol phosphatase-like enzyme (inositol monophosphatase family)